MSLGIEHSKYNNCLPWKRYFPKGTQFDFFLSFFFLLNIITVIILNGTYLYVCTYLYICTRVLEYGNIFKTVWVSLCVCGCLFLSRFWRQAHVLRDLNRFAAIISTGILSQTSFDWSKSVLWKITDNPQRQNNSILVLLTNRKPFGVFFFVFFFLG